jgi:hypothetical protein
VLTLGGACGLLRARPRALDHPDLALGALRDLTDGRGDLADRAAGLVGRRGHLLGGGGDGAGGGAHLADQGPELVAHRVVGGDAADGLVDDERRRFQLGDERFVAA